MRSPHYVRNLLIATLLAVLAAFLFLIIALAQMQLDAFLAPHPSIPDETPADYGMPYEELDLTTDDGLRLAAWYIPAPQANGAAVVLVHGRGGDRTALLPTAEILASHGYSLLMIDLRAHGQSDGEIVTYGYLESYDVLAALDYLTHRSDIDRDQIGLLGQSLGGAAVIRAAAYSDIPQAMVIESTFRSLPAAVEDTFDNMSNLPQWPFVQIIVWQAQRVVGVEIAELDLARDLALFAPRPILLIHGAQDDLLPLDHHLALFRAAGEPKQAWVIEGMGHESAALYSPVEYERRLIEFFDKYLCGTSISD